MSLFCLKESWNHVLLSKLDVPGLNQNLCSKAAQEPSGVGGVACWGYGGGDLLGCVNCVKLQMLPGRSQQYKFF